MSQYFKVRPPRSENFSLGFSSSQYGNLVLSTEPVYNVNYPYLRFEAEFRALALCQSASPSLKRRANARNVSFQTLNVDQFTLSTQLILPNYFVIPHHSFLRNLPLLFIYDVYFRIFSTDFVSFRFILLCLVSQSTD